MSLKMNELKIVSADLDQVGELAPLWGALHTHHGEVAPQFGPLRSAAESWELRKANYIRWLSEEEAFVLIAQVGGTPVGYAFVVVEPLKSATWHRPDRIGLVETLAVLPTFRARGIGTQLMQAVYTALSQRGVTEVSLMVAASNHAAVGFYERHGFSSQFQIMGRQVPRDDALPG